MAPLTPRPFTHRLAPRLNVLTGSDSVYWVSNEEIPMNEVKPVKTAIVEPLVRYTPAETARNKKARDIRRKSIRDQNVRSKMK
jgi:hypothetical protein